jgi:hypothetical protein
LEGFREWTNLILAETRSIESPKGKGADKPEGRIDGLSGICLRRMGWKDLRGGFRTYPRLFSDLRIFGSAIFINQRVGKAERSCNAFSSLRGKHEREGSRASLSGAARCSILNKYSFRINNEEALESEIAIDLNCRCTKNALPASD